MKNPRTTVLAAAAAVLLATSAFTAWQVTQDHSGPPSPPTDSGGVFDVLYARPFRLAEGYTHWHRLERPTVTAGHLLVLAVDPARVVPRQLLEPVLYVGDETAERVNHGQRSGVVVAIAPALEGPDGEPLFDLEREPVWFGTPELPERVDAARVAQEQLRALVEGLRPLAPERVRAAQSAGGELLELPDRTALERVAAELVLQYSPDEAELASELLIPITR